MAVTVKFGKSGESGVPMVASAGEAAIIEDGNIGPMSNRGGLLVAIRLALKVLIGALAIMAVQIVPSRAAKVRTLCKS
jgi:hypothetical protein